MEGSLDEVEGSRGRGASEQFPAAPGLARGGSERFYSCPIMLAGDVPAARWSPPSASARPDLGRVPEALTLYESNANAHCRAITAALTEERMALVRQ
jgi:hypothetical protein